MVDRLIDILGKEATLFESFLDLLEQQQRMLVEKDVEGLNRITDLQREKLVESQILNRRREEVIEQIKTVNAVKGDLNVVHLLDIVDRKHADQLVKLRNLILNLTEKITHTRNQNAMLLNRSRQYIVKTMETLSRIYRPDTTCDVTGVECAQPATAVVDRRA